MEEVVFEFSQTQAFRLWSLQAANMTSAPVPFLRQPYRSANLLQPRPRHHVANFASAGSSARARGHLIQASLPVV